MKLIIKIFCLCASIAVLFSACKKNVDDRGDGRFDINNPFGYGMFVATPSGAPLAFMEFTPVKTIKGYMLTPGGMALPEVSYQIIDGNIIETEEGARYKIENGKITYNPLQGSGIAELIKMPDINSLSGKTFTGTYYKSNGDVLHQNFFYSFRKDATVYEAGHVPGQPTYTHTYTAYNHTTGFAIRSDSPYAGDKEMFIAVNDKLYVSYYSKSGDTFHYALLDQQ